MPSTDALATGLGRSPLPAAATGLGLRRALLQDLRDAPAGDIDFLECAPENWIGVGGPAGEALAELAEPSEQFPEVAVFRDSIQSSTRGITR